MFLSKTALQFNRLSISLSAKELCLLIMVVSLFWSLAFWQLSRASDNREQALLLIEKKQGAAVALQSLRDPTDPKHQLEKVFVKGRYIDQSILIKDAFFKGQRGYEVFTPFELSSGGPLLLVSRGWHIDGKVPLSVEQLKTEQQLIGQLRLPPANAFFLEPVVSDTTWPVTLHHFQLSTVSRLYEQPLMNIVLRLHPPQPGALVAHWSIIAPKTTNHIAYALQWLAFSVIALMIYLIRNSNAIELLQEPTP